MQLNIATPDGSTHKCAIRDLDKPAGEQELVVTGFVIQGSAADDFFNARATYVAYEANSREHRPVVVSGGITQLNVTIADDETGAADMEEFPMITAKDLEALISSLKEQIKDAGQQNVREKQALIAIKDAPDGMLMDDIRKMAAQGLGVK